MQPHMEKGGLSLLIVVPGLRHPQQASANQALSVDHLSMWGPGRPHGVRGGRLGLLVVLGQRLWAVMSPLEVVARMSSSVVPVFLRELLTRP